ncbi:MAG: alpha/beta hydrolase family protein [Pirellulaceae bacterium]
MKCSRSICVALIGIGWVSLARGQEEVPANPEGLKEFVAKRNQEYGRQLEAHLADWLVQKYENRAEAAWQRDYSSIEAFVASVEPNRRRWRAILSPPELPVTGPLQRRPHPPLEDLGGEWLTVSLGPLKAEAVLVVPKSAGKPVPLVIAQHGIGSFPERVFGVIDDGNAYHSYARELVEAGFAVLAPFNLRNAGNRNRIERLCRLADTTLPGIELTRLQRLLDGVLQDPRIDRERVGMWGVSLGGMATMFWMPLEPRIKAGVVCAWFNHRRNKMVIPDERYSCFLETREEHAFFRGWLTEFSDDDAVALICPRPLLIQTGKKDRIAHWPQVVEEYERARSHYQTLGIAERMEMDLHDGGHEARVTSGVDFLSRWLRDREAPL